MSSQAIHDYLVKEITIERNIVTYRSLSRAMRIHVNVAKNELAQYHVLASFESQASRSAATYLLSGEALAPHTRSYEDEDIDMEEEDEISEDGDSDGDGDEVARTRHMLVNEKDLEVAKTQFVRLHSIHVYSLAPSPIRDAGLLCAPTDAIRSMDAQQGSTMISIFGKIVGRNIEVRAMPIKGKALNQAMAGPSKLKTGNSTKPATEPLEKSITGGTVGKGDAATDKKSKGKTKPSGKLDFTKVKVKELRKAEAKETQVDQKKEVEQIGPDISLPKPGTCTRGKKRKSPVVASDSDEEEGFRSMPVQVPDRIARVKNRTVISDDEDQDHTPLPARRFRKSARASEPLEADVESEARALMDVDDDQVVRVTRDASPVTIEGDEQDAAKEVYNDPETSDDAMPKAKVRKRRVKKVVPIGTNGLKKRRIVKSRMTTDAKGYMVTEDYSSYESAEENDEPEPKPRRNLKEGSLVKARPKKEDLSSTPPLKLKPAKAGASVPKATKSKPAHPKQKSLAGFFSAPNPKN